MCNRSAGAAVEGQVALLETGMHLALKAAARCDALHDGLHTSVHKPLRVHHSTMKRDDHLFVAHVHTHEGEQAARVIASVHEP